MKDWLLEHAWVLPVTVAVEVLLLLLLLVALLRLSTAVDRWHRQQPAIIQGLRTSRRSLKDLDAIVLQAQATWDGLATRFMGGYSQSRLFRFMMLMLSKKLGT